MVYLVHLPPHSDNVEEELGRIRLALNTVYSPVNSTRNSTTTNGANTTVWFQERQSANQYLTSFQNTTISWVVCDRILWENTKNTTHVNLIKLQQEQFFAAQTLLTKCRSDQDIQQLLLTQQNIENKTEISVLVSLRDSLLQHLNRNEQMNCTGTDSVLSTRLAMCISALAVQMGWTTILNDLLSSSTSFRLETTTVLFLLRALPEECASDRLLLIQGDEARFLMRDHLIEKSATVFSFLFFHFQQASQQQQQQQQGSFLLRVLQGWYAWIRFVPVPAHVIAKTPLLSATVDILVAAAAAAAAASQGTTSSAAATSPLLRPDIVEQATDVIVEIFRMYPSHGPQENQSLMEPMLNMLLTKLPLQQVLLKTTTTTKQQQQQQCDDDHDDLDDVDDSLARDYCRVITEMAESYLGWILMAASSSSSPHEHDAAFRLVDSVLLCSSISSSSSLSSSSSSRELAAMTLGFWYRMVMNLEDTEPMEWRQDLIDLFSTRLLHLVRICADSLIKYPADIFVCGDGNDIVPPQDLVDEINRHRHYVAETVEDCCRLLGGQAVLQCIAELLQQQQQQQHRGDWQAMEACLACLVAIHKFIPEDEDRLLPFVFEHVFPPLTAAEVASSSTTATTSISLPPPLRLTMYKVIGKFARWLVSHATTHPNLVAPLLPFLAQGLAVSSTATDQCWAPSAAAAVAIKELCVESHPNSFAIAQPVLELYEQVAAAANTSSIGMAAHSTAVVHVVDLRDELELLEGVCLALSKHIYLEQQPKPYGSGGGTVDGSSSAAAFLQRLVQPIGNRLSASSNSSTSTPRTILPDLQRLSVVVQHLNVGGTTNTDIAIPTSAAPQQQQHQQHPIVELMQSLWPILETLIIRFPNDSNTAERICQLHKHAMRACGPAAYAPLLPHLVHHLVEGYRQSRQSPFLYAASICVSEYGGTITTTIAGAAAAAAAEEDNKKKKALLFGMVDSLVQITFSFLKNVQDFNDHPDAVEELFYLMERVVNYCPDVFAFNPALLQSMVQSSICCMELDHHGANKGTMKFLDSLLSLGLPVEKDIATNTNNTIRTAPEHKLLRVAIEQVLLGHQQHPPPNGMLLVKQLVYALAGALPTCSPKVPDILFKLQRLVCHSSNNNNNKNDVLFAQWLSSSLVEDSLAFVPDHVKDNFTASMSRTMTAAGSSSVSPLREDFILAVRLFQHACKRRRNR